MELATELFDPALATTAELVVAAQAIDLRKPKLGTGAEAAHGFVRARIPFLDSPERMPLPLEELATAIRSQAAPT